MFDITKMAVLNAIAARGTNFEVYSNGITVFESYAKAEPFYRQYNGIIVERVEQAPNSTFLKLR